MVRIRVRVFIKRASRVDGVELVDIAILRRLAGKTSFKFDIYRAGPAEETAALDSLRWQLSRIAYLRAVFRKSSRADETTESSSYGGAIWMNGSGL